MEIQSSWTELKNFYDANKPLASLNYINIGEAYYIWSEFRTVTIFCKIYQNSTEEFIEFQTYLPFCNIKEAEKVRVTNCKIGRKLHDRYVTFTTAKATDNIDNTDYNDQSYGDIVYTMRNVNKEITTFEEDCKETWLDFMPLYNYEVSSGFLYVPSTVTTDDWEVHIIGVPDIPANQGGCVNFIANPHLKWNAGEYLFLDSSMNPAELLYSPYGTNKIRIIIKHPLGAQEQFQLNIKVFK